MSILKKSFFGLILWIVFQVSAMAQANLIDFSSIPKAGTALVYTHQDDDLIWMFPFWKITEKFIGGAMPPSPNFRTLIHEQQTLLNSSGTNINYESNWLTPWSDVSDIAYTQYYWSDDPVYAGLVNDHLKAFWDDSDLPLVRREINKIKAKLEQYISSPDISRIITHDNWGEYGHQQHKAINVAVRELAVKYRKDVWMLGCGINNGDFVDVSVPSGITYTMGSFDTPDLYTGIRSVYQKYGRWTWLTNIPSGDHVFIKIVDAGVDKSNTLTGETVTSSGPSQNEPGAYIFDGIDDYMTLPGNNNASFTIAMRVRPDQIKKMDISKMTEYPTSASFDRSFTMESDGKITAHVFNGGSKSVTSKTELVAGNWSNILMTGDATWLKLYINGIAEDSITTGSSFTVFDSPEFVMGQTQETTNFYKGQINDVQFYNYALSESEISTLFGVTPPSTFTITASAGSGGTINPSGSSIVARGSSQGYTISPENGYFISDVFVDGTSVGQVSGYNFNNIKANHTIAVEFLPVTMLNLALNKFATAESYSGTNVPSRANDNDGTNNSFWSATPYSQWWKVDLGNIYDITSIVIRNFVDNNRYYQYDIEASVDDIVYTSVASKNNTSKATDIGDTYTVNATARYLRVNMTYNSANSGVHISDFRAYGTLNNSTFYNITSSAGSNGVIDPEGTVKKIEGSHQTFNITPDYAYQISDVNVDGISKGDISSYNFNNITANHSISATFTPVTYNITASAGTNGNISPSGISTVNMGASATYAITPNTGYQISDVKVDNISVGAVSSYTFDNITEDHTISTTFVTAKYTITGNSGSGGNLNPAGIVTLNYGTSQSYNITANTGYQISDVKIDNVSVGAVTSYTFNNVKTNHTISVTFTHITFNITGSSGTGGNIDPDGIVTINYGTSQLYNITPNTGYQISDVKVDNISVGVVSAYTFNNITANHTISASFIPVTFTLTGIGGSGGNISPAGIVTVNYGTSQSYNITPNTGFRTTDVKVDDISVGALSVYTFNTITANHKISAMFAPITFALTGTAGTGGIISPAGIVTLNYGTTQSYNIAPNTGFKISDVKVDNSSIGAVSAYTFNNIRANHTISATFTPITFTITGTSGAGGIINPAGIVTINYGTNQTYNITPETGYKISDVKVDNISVGTVSAYTFNNITANHTISAAFTPITYTITGTAGTGGILTPSGMATVNYGTTQFCSITPGTGYLISDVKVDNISVGAVYSYTFNNITANHTISATFKPITFTITGASVTDGNIIPGGIVTMNYGTSQSFSINASRGFRISDVKIDNISVGPVSVYTFNNVTANHTISASFMPATYIISGNAGNNGIISPAGIITINYGTSQSYNITANYGYQISDVKIDNESIGSVSSYTFNNITSDHTISAAFTPLIFTIAESAGVGGIIKPEGIISVNHSSNETYTIVPDKGYRITDVIIDDISLGPIDAYVFNNVNSNHKISATFIPITYVITKNSGVGGKISPSVTDIVYEGTHKTYSISADSGYQISDVMIDGISVGAVSTYTFENITENHTISATFAEVRNIYKISATAETGGTISPDGITELAQGLSQTYNFTVDRRYRISDVIIDNVSMGILPGYTFRNINADHTISVSFLTKEASETDNYNNIEVTVYPNPFTDEFTVRIDDPHEELFNLSILNSSGQQVYYKTRLSSKNLIIFKEPLIEGVYYLEFFNREKKIVRCIVKK